MKLNAIYKVGNVQVVPHVTVIKIVVGDRVLDTYKVEEIDEAIRTADEMASRLQELPQAA